MILRIEEQLEKLFHDILFITMCKYIIKHQGKIIDLKEVDELHTCDKLRYTKTTH